MGVAQHRHQWLDPTTSIYSNFIGRYMCKLCKSCCGILLGAVGTVCVQQCNERFNGSLLGDGLLRLMTVRTPRKRSLSAGMQLFHAQGVQLGCAGWWIDGRCDDVSRALLVSG